jgi:hypothetical protein
MMPRRQSKFQATRHLSLQYVTSVDTR